MAFAQFLRNGYVGKLGDTIGQSQRGKMIIKTYAVPKNPRTPAQQANRNRFAVANDYVNSLKMLGAFPDVEGDEKAQYQSRQIQYFLTNINALKKSLRGLQYKNYAEHEDLDVEFDFECQENAFVGVCEVQLFSEEEEIPYKTAVLCYVIYDYEQQKLIYGETPPVEIEQDEWDAEHWEAILDFEIERSPDFPRKRFPFYAFVKIDGKPYNSTYENVEVI